MDVIQVQRTLTYQKGATNMKNWTDCFHKTCTSIPLHFVVLKVYLLSWYLKNKWGKKWWHCPSVMFLTKIYWTYIILLVNTSELVSRNSQQDLKLYVSGSIPLSSSHCDWFVCLCWCLCSIASYQLCVCVCVSHRIAAFLLTICFMVCPSGTAPLSQSQFNTPYTSQYLPSHSQNIYNAV